MVKNALHDSSAVQLRWKYGHKALALAGSFMAEEKSDLGERNTDGLCTQNVTTSCNQIVYTGKLEVFWQLLWGFTPILG